MLEIGREGVKGKIKASVNLFILQYIEAKIKYE